MCSLTKNETFCNNVFTSAMLEYSQTAKWHGRTHYRWNRYWKRELLSHLPHQSITPARLFRKYMGRKNGKFQNVKCVQRWENEITLLCTFSWSFCSWCFVKQTWTLASAANGSRDALRNRQTIIMLWWVWILNIPVQARQRVQPWRRRCEEDGESTTTDLNDMLPQWPFDHRVN